MNEDIIEFKRIRKRFKASREQFGTVFLGKTCATVTNYERGRTPIPQSVMMLARAWEKILDELTGDKQCQSR